MTMQLSFALDSSPLLPRLRERLIARYGRQRDEFRLDPLSQLINALISSRTKDEVSFPAFLRLRRHYKSWDQITRALPAEVQAIIHDVTHAEVKAVQLPEALRMIAARTGNLSLAFLADWPEEAALAWLEDLPGIGPRNAATVLNFSTLRRRTFSVNTHLLRVGKRLGLLPPAADYKLGRDVFMRLIPDDWNADDLYEFHWLMKLHGQRLCTNDAPPCSHCPLRDLCSRRFEAAVQPTHRSFAARGGGSVVRMSA
jgi:endonuclease-3